MADQDYKDVLNRIADGLERLTEALEKRNAAAEKLARCPTCSGDGKGYNQSRCIRCGGTGVKQG
jgi:DnaJ-class molecular chaperone